jgi:hypothetical protein
MSDREYISSYLTPISNYEEQLQENGYIVVKLEEVIE